MLRNSADPAAACRAELGELNAAAWTKDFVSAKRTLGSVLTALPLLPAEQPAIKNIRLVAYSILGGRKMTLYVSIQMDRRDFLGFGCT